MDENNEVAEVIDGYDAHAAEHLGDWELNTFEEATRVAESATALGERRYIPVDRGSNCSPQFGVIAAPRVGDPVSYAFNGDYYPCGVISAMSRSLYKITTDEGNVFFRRKQTGNWKMKGGTWSLVMGHHDERNPSF